MNSSSQVSLSKLKNVFTVLLNCSVSSHQLDVFRRSSFKDYFVGCTVESFG